MDGDIQEGAELILELDSLFRVELHPEIVEYKAWKRVPFSLWLVIKQDPSRSRSATVTANDNGPLCGGSVGEDGFNPV